MKIECASKAFTPVTFTANTVEELCMMIGFLGNYSSSAMQKEILDVLKRMELPLDVDKCGVGILIDKMCSDSDFGMLKKIAADHLGEKDED